MPICHSACNRSILELLLKVALRASPSCRDAPNIVPCSASGTRLPLPKQAYNTAMPDKEELMNPNDIRWDLYESERAKIPIPSASQAQELFNRIWTTPA